MSLNAANGQISGTPTAAANGTPLTFKVTDSGSPAQTASASFSLTITSPPLGIATTSLANAIAGVGYSFTLAASGGTPPYSWSASGLPTGLAVTGNQILGTPSSLGTASVTLTVTDSTLPTPMTKQVTLPLTVVRLLIIGTTSLPDATSGSPYTSPAMNASGGTPPYTWSATNLPAGLSMAPSTGVISGTTTASSAQVTITVTDSGSPTQTVSTNPPLQLNVIGGFSGTFTITNVSVGKNLQALITVSIATPAPTSGQPLTLTSGDPTRIVMNGQSGQTSQITTSIAGGTTSVSLFVQALADNGLVQMTASAPNFNSLGGSITLTPSGFVLSAGSTPGGSFNANQGSSTTLTVASARLDTSNNFAEFQPIRTGFTTAVPISNTSSTVGTVSPSSVTFNGGDSSFAVAFNAANTGATTQASATLTATVPAGFALPANSANSLIAFIAGAGIIPCNTTVGKSLEAACNITLNGTAPGPGVLNVAITSGDPTKLLLSNTPDGAGQSQITVTVAPNHSISSTFYVFGLASSGTPTYSASASGFGSATGTITLAPSGFIISGPNLGLDFTTNTSTPVGVIVYSALLTPSGDFSTTQSVAGGQSITVNTTNTDIPPASGVGTLESIPIDNSRGKRFWRFDVPTLDFRLNQAGSGSAGRLYYAESIYQRQGNGKPAGHRCDLRRGGWVPSPGPRIPDPGGNSYEPCGGDYHQ